MECFQMNIKVSIASRWFSIKYHSSIFISSNRLVVKSRCKKLDKGECTQLHPRSIANQWLTRWILIGHVITWLSSTWLHSLTGLAEWAWNHEPLLQLLQNCVFFIIDLVGGILGMMGKNKTHCLQQEVNNIRTSCSERLYLLAQVSRFRPPSGGLLL